MKFTESMLRDYVTLAESAEQIGDLLTMTGFELEDIEVVEGEKVLDVNIMANRGDGASVIGMAREVLAKSPAAKPTRLWESASARFPASDAGSRDVWNHCSPSIQTPECTRFAARVFLDVENGPSPAKLQERLRKIGQRPISLLVDLTNYVMFETGQPLHAYDLDKLPGGTITVRQAEAGEILTTLDEKEHKLSPENMVICDAARPIGVAGVMGGLDTEVSETTTRCLLEAAHFRNTSVRRTRKQLGLHTEASYRFERHVDPEGVVAALNRFAELYEESTGKRPVPGVADVYPAKPEIRQVRVRVSRASTLLGMAVTLPESRGYLESLGFIVVGQDQDSLSVVVPSWRSDIEREEDLVEEIGRVHGYEKIPAELPIGSTPVGGAHGFEELTDKVRESMLRCGFTQCVSHSLGDAHALDADTVRVVVRSPHAPEMALLRNSNLPCLSDAANRNEVKDIHLFEIGRVFSEGLEQTGLAVLSIGRFDTESWRDTDATEADFFTLKGVVSEILRSIGLEAEFVPGPQDARFHPGRSAKVVVHGVVCGVMGQIHPEVARACPLSAKAVMADLVLDTLSGLTTEERGFRAVSRHPAIRRDIAFVIDQSVPFSKVSETVVAAAGDCLESHWLFDVYVGGNVPAGSHSLALGLQLRKPDSTFTDEEANQVRDSVVSALESLGARLR